MMQLMYQLVMIKNNIWNLSRDIANKFNLDFNSPKFFIAPEPLIQKNFARIMSFKDGTKK